MRHLDLFSGIGGFSLGLERTGGFETLAFCEQEEFCRNVLRRHWPDVPIHPDIRDLTGDAVGPVDIVTGGPPCTRTSVAAAIHGKRTGETLWPEQLRLIGELRPDWAIIEQPPGNAAWEAEVKRGLEGLGCGVARLVGTARGAGAPHLRRRVFMLANRDRERLARAGTSAASALATIPGTAVDRGHWLPANARTVRVDDGLPGGLDRRARIAALGSAVIPWVVEAIGQAILEAEVMR